MDKIIDLKLKIKTTSYWMAYFCGSELSKKARKAMQSQINEWEAEIDVRRKHKEVC